MEVYVGVTEEEAATLPYRPVSMREGLYLTLSCRGVPYRDIPTALYHAYWEEPFKVAGQPVSYTDINQPGFRMSEMPSACINATAGGLGELAAYMAERGSLGEERLLSEAAWAALHAGVTSADRLGPYHATTHFSQGGVNQFLAGDTLGRCRGGFWGWMGYGGSVFQWHPQLRIGFAFVTSELEMDVTNLRAGMLQDAVVRAVRGDDREEANWSNWLSF